MKFTLAFTVLACTVIARASTMPNVLNDIAEIAVAFNSWAAMITAFPSSGGSPAAGLAIYTPTGTILTPFNTATTHTDHLTPLPVSLADGTTIVAAAGNLEPTIINAINSLVNKKSALAALPIDGLPTLLKTDLDNLSTATQAFEVAIIAKALASPQASATSFRDAINSAFATAIATYS